MTVEEISKLITEKNYLFQVSIPNTAFRHSRISVSQALSDSPTLEDYFKRIVDTNRAKNLLVRLFTPNGSSYKNRGEHLIFFDQPGTVATVAENKTNVATPKNYLLHGLEPLSEKPMMDPREKIEFEVLKVRHEMLTGRNKDLETQNKELQKKVEALHDEKLALVKENSVAGERAKLELDRAQLEHLRESKDGLSGLIGDINENPETLKLLIGLFKPDHPMLKDSASGVSGTAQLEAPRYHDDADLNALLQDLPNTIKDLDPKIISKIYVIFLNAFAKNPATVDQAFKLLLPDLAQKEQ